MIQKPCCGEQRILFTLRNCKSNEMDRELRGSYLTLAQRKQGEPSCCGSGAAGFCGCIYNLDGKNEHIYLPYIHPGVICKGKLNAVYSKASTAIKDYTLNVSTVSSTICNYFPFCVLIPTACKLFKIYDISKHKFLWMCFSNVEWYNSSKEDEKGLLLEHYLQGPCTCNKNTSFSALSEVSIPGSLQGGSHMHLEGQGMFESLHATLETVKMTRC